MAGKSLRTTLLTLALLAAEALRAAVLASPQALRIDPKNPSFSWAPVAGAGAYRVAVFDQAGPDGKREVLAAVWVQGNAWTYGLDGVLPRLGNLPSTALKPLPRRRKLRVSVAAARADGSDKGEWTTGDLELGVVPVRAVREAILDIEIGEKWSGPDEDQ